MQPTLYCNKISELNERYANVGKHKRCIGLYVHESLRTVEIIAISLVF